MEIGDLSKSVTKKYKKRHLTTTKYFFQGEPTAKCRLALIAQYLITPLGENVFLSSLKASDRGDCRAQNSIITFQRLTYRFIVRGYKVLRHLNLSTNNKINLHTSEHTIE